MQWSEDNSWEKRYQSGETEWDKGEPAPGLVDFLDENPGKLKGRVLYPGCGFGYDAQVWSRAGLHATGMDIAATAIREAQLKAQGEFDSSQLEFKLGNFLLDSPTESFDVLFEHTLFCAIDPSDREAYVEAALRWLKPEGHFLAIHYMIPDVDGPPFGVTEEEIYERFSPGFDLLQGSWIPRSYPNRTGLERMYLWVKK